MVDDANAIADRWLTAEQATASLGVSRQTLYAYVSRGRIGATAAPDEPRRSLYDAADVRRLTERNRDGRSRRAVAASTISWGEPILPSEVTRIAGGRLYYRDSDAITLADTATLEQVAALLWQAEGVPPVRSRGTWPRAHAEVGSAERCVAAMAGLATAGCWSGTTEPVLPDAVRIIDQLAWAAAGLPGTRARGSAVPMHQRLASAWNAGPKAADMIRRALVLTADHELNPSTYATRVVASTRAPLGACVLAGLAALSGPLHGGMTNQVRALLFDPAMRCDPRSAVATRLARGELIPGFGHRLYPDGDPRAAALLQRLASRSYGQATIDAVRAATGIKPDIDCALLVMEKRLRLPQGAAFAIFAIGRSVGWIAHALEQWHHGTLIWPRAIHPGSAAAAVQLPILTT